MPGDRLTNNPNCYQGDHDWRYGNECGCGAIRPTDRLADDQVHQQHERCHPPADHRVYRECLARGKDIATLTARVEVLQECIRRLVATHQQPQSAWQAGSPCAVEFALAMGETPERES